MSSCDALSRGDSLGGGVDDGGRRRDRDLQERLGLAPRDDGQALDGATGRVFADPAHEEALVQATALAGRGHEAADDHVAENAAVALDRSEERREPRAADGAADLRVERLVEALSGPRLLDVGGQMTAGAARARAERAGSRRSPWR